MSGTVTFPNTTDFPPFTPTVDSVSFPAAANGSTLGQVSLGALKTYINGGSSGAITRNIPYSPFTVTPIGNPFAPTVSGFAIQGTTQYAAQREWMLVVGINSNTGANQGNNGDKVAIYGAITATAGSGDIWSFNTVTTISANTGSITSWAYEADINNYNRDTSNDLLKSSYGIGITGASSFGNTAALMVSENNPFWYRGIMLVNNSIKDVGFEDRSSSGTMLRAVGNHALALDTIQANLSSGAIAMALGQSAFWSNKAQTRAVSDVVDGAFNRYVGNGAAATFVGGAVLGPISDQGGACGNSFNRWTTVTCASGFIQTSDEREKIRVDAQGSPLTEPAEIEDLTPMFMDILPFRSKFKVGGAEPYIEHEDVEEQATEEVTHMVTENQLIDGKWTMVTLPKTETIKVWDHEPVIDPKTGKQAIDRIQMTIKAMGPDGTIVERPIIGRDGKQVIRDVPRIHAIPKMITVKRPVTKYQDREGKRIHLHFSAQEVKAAAQKHNFGDFAAHTLQDPNDPNSRQGLRYEQLLGVAWVTLRHQKMRLDRLEAQLGHQQLKAA